MYLLIINYYGNEVVEVYDDLDEAITAHDVLSEHGFWVTLKRK
jgi:hypothetical protein